MGKFSARAPSQIFLSHVGVEPLGPPDLLAKGRTRFPGPMPAIGAPEAPYMQPQHDGMLQDGQVAEAPRSALLHVGAARLASGTHEGIISALERQIELLGLHLQVNDTEFW